MKTRLKNHWMQLEKEYGQLDNQKIELDSFKDFEEIDITQTTCYMLLEQRMDQIIKQQQMYERMGVLD